MRTPVHTFTRKMTISVNSEENKKKKLKSFGKRLKSFTNKWMSLEIS